MNVVRKLYKPEKCDGCGGFGRLLRNLCLDCRRRLERKKTKGGAMKFFEAMRSKWGFSDGEAMIEGVEVYRDVYVKTINRVAEVLGSKTRAFTFDRSGMHNWCLILFGVAADPGCSEDALDPEMERALDIVDHMNIDGFVEVTVAVNSGFEAWLSDEVAVKRAIEETEA